MSKDKLQRIFDKFPTYCQPWSATKAEAKTLGIKHPECNSATVFQWSCKGSGFGEFSFRVGKDGKTYCDNEMEPKWFVKLLLMKMVDDSVFGPVFKKEDEDGKSNDS